MSRPNRNSLGQFSVKQRCADGRGAIVYQIDAANGIVFGLKGLPIKKVNGRGYIEIRSTRRSQLAHRMIFESVHGPIPKGLEINHINGIKTDNRIANLELVTSSENTLHAYRMELASAKGNSNGRHIGKMRKLAALARAGASA